MTNLAVSGGTFPEELTISLVAMTLGCNNILLLFLERGGLRLAISFVGEFGEIILVGVLQVGKPSVGFSCVLHLSLVCEAGELAVFNSPLVGKVIF